MRTLLQLWFLWMVFLLPVRAAVKVDEEMAALVRGFTNSPGHSNALAASRHAATNAQSGAHAVSHHSNSLTSATINEALRDSQEHLATTNLLTHPEHGSGEQDLRKQASFWQEKLEIARRQRLSRLYPECTPTLITIVTQNAPEDIKRTALLELAIIAQDEGNLAKAQQILAHFLTKWPEDLSIPEVLLRQGLIFRKMGMNNLALTKFYAVMTSSITLRADKLDYYQRLVLQAQTEIAETYFQQGKYQDSIEFLTRLLRLNSPLLNKPQIHFKLVRSLASMARYEEVSFQGFEFLNRYQQAQEEPEVRYHLATALKHLGRNNDSLQQVLFLLQTQQTNATVRPEVWAYWQQRTGNDIANQLYKDGDYLRALEVYAGLAVLSSNADWQLPVWYQIGLTYEKLQQPAKAQEQYGQIVRREAEVVTNAAPALRTVLDMSRWRMQYLSWQTNTDMIYRNFKTASASASEGQKKPAQP